MDPSMLEPPATMDASQAAEGLPSAGRDAAACLRTLLADQLNDLYAAERDTMQVLGELAGAAASPRLAYLFRLNVIETREQIQRLRRVLEVLGLRAGPMRLHGKRGLLEDCVRMAETPGMPGALRDAALIAVAQHLEHDAIATYDCVCHWAGLLGLQEVAGLLALNMAEERRAESRLRRLGVSMQSETVGASVAYEASCPHKA